LPESKEKEKNKSKERDLKGLQRREETRLKRPLLIIHLLFSKKNQSKKLPKANMFLHPCVLAPKQVVLFLRKSKNHPLLLLPLPPPLLYLLPFLLPLLLLPLLMLPLLLAHPCPLKPRRNPKRVPMFPRANAKLAAIILLLPPLLLLNPLCKTLGMSLGLKEEKIDLKETIVFLEKEIDLREETIVLLEMLREEMKDLPEPGKTSPKMMAGLP